MLVLIHTRCTTLVFVDREADLVKSVPDCTWCPDTLSTGCQNLSDTTPGTGTVPVGTSMCRDAGTFLGSPQNAPTIDCLERAAASHGLSEGALELNPATSPLASLAHTESTGTLPKVSLAMADTESS